MKSFSNVCFQTFAATFYSSSCGSRLIILNVGSLAGHLSILEVDDNALFILLVKPTTTRCGNAAAPGDHLNKTLPCTPHSPTPIPSPPGGDHYGTAPFN